MIAKKVLITGVRGFTGKYLRTHLESKGHTVIGIVESNPGHNEYQSNLKDFAGLKDVLFQTKPEMVVHLAGIAFVGHSDILSFYETNVIGTENLLRACVETNSGNDKIILASSANIYGANPNSPLAESVIPEPVNHYAISKLSMEHVARTFFPVLPIIISRPFNYTGVGQSDDFVIPKIAAHFKRKASKIRLGNTSVKREYNDVRLICEMYAALLETKLTGQTVNLCTGVAFSLDDILRLVSTLARHTIEVETDSSLIRKNEIPELYGDIHKIGSIVDLSRTPSIETTLKWFLESE